jgi:hypothetical protein
MSAAPTGFADMVVLNGTSWDFEAPTTEGPLPPQPEPAPPAPATPVPTMSQWALIMLALMMAGIGITRVRGRAQG